MPNLYATHEMESAIRDTETLNQYNQCPPYQAEHRLGLDHGHPDALEELAKQQYDADALIQYRNHTR